MFPLWDGCVRDSSPKVLEELWALECPTHQRVRDVPVNPVRYRLPPVTSLPRGEPVTGQCRERDVHHSSQQKGRKPPSGFSGGGSFSLSPGPGPGLRFGGCSPPCPPPPKPGTGAARGQRGLFLKLLDFALRQPEFLRQNSSPSSFLRVGGKRQHKPGLPPPAPGRRRRGPGWAAPGEPPAGTDTPLNPLPGSQRGRARLPPTRPGGGGKRNGGGPASAGPGPGGEGSAVRSLCGKGRSEDEVLKPRSILL